jgi:MFS family permease
VWASLILAVLLVPVGKKNGESWTSRLPVRRLGTIATATTILVLASAMAWFGYALQLRSSESAAQGNSAAWGALNPVGRVLLLVLHTGTIVTEQVGTFGWLDTPLPQLAVLAWVSVAGVAAIIWFVGRNELVPRWSIGVVLGLGYLAALLDEYVGAWGWQGRYLLPVTAAVFVLAVPGLMTGLGRLPALRSLVPWMTVTLMAVNALSVVWFLFRNVYGVRTGPRRLPSAPGPVGTPAWTPPYGQGMVLALVALALACGVAAVWGQVRAHLQVPGGAQPDCEEV